MADGISISWSSATLSDVDEIASLWERCGLGAGIEVDSVEIQRRLAADQELFVTGLRDGVMVASAMVCWDGHRAHVKRVAIDPSEQGTGLGQQLMTETERRLTELGMTELRLAVWDHNATALNFWMAQGWHELEDIRYFTKSLDDSQNPIPERFR